MLTITGALAAALGACALRHGHEFTIRFALAGAEPFEQRLRVKEVTWVRNERGAQYEYVVEER